MYNVTWRMKQNHCIGFDAEYAYIGSSELGSYGRYIVSALAASCDKTTYFRMYAPNQEENADYEALTKLPNVESMTPDGRWWRKMSALWHVAKVSWDARHGNVELYHGLSNKLPWGLSHNNIRSIVTIHNLGFLRATHSNPIMRQIRRLRLKSACHRADRIIAISECTKQDIVEWLDIDPDKIDVVYHGCHARYGEPVDEARITEARERYRLPDKYLLTVGTHKSYKNIELAFEALATLPDDIHLVVVGNHTPYTEELRNEIERLNIESRVLMPSGVAEEDMPAVYAAAEMLLCTSRHEGFSTPIVEAMSIGIPVIAVHGTCHEEAGGKAAIYVSPDDSEELTDNINVIMGSESLRHRMITEGKEQVMRFRPEVAAYNILNCYKRIGIDLTELRR